VRAWRHLIRRHEICVRPAPAIPMRRLLRRSCDFMALTVPLTITGCDISDDDTARTSVDTNTDGTVAGDGVSVRSR
jgi:hypothetical protein